MSEPGSEQLSLKSSPETVTSEIVQGKVEQSLQKALDGSDLEGRRLYEATKAAVKGSEKGNLPYITSVYKAAEQSLGKINEPGEINKLTSFLDALYKQAGKDGYQLEIKLEGKLQDLTPEQRQELTRNQVTKDFGDVDSLIAGHKTERYAEVKGELSDVEDNARKELKKEGLSRGEARLIGVRVTNARRQFLESVNIYSTRIGNTEVGSEVATSYKESWQYKEGAGELNKFEPDSEKIDESVKVYKEKLTSEDKDREAGLLDRMDNKEKFFVPLLDIDQKIIEQKTKIEEAINAPPDVLAEMVTEYHNLQFERKLRVANIDVAIARRRIEESDKSWLNARNSLGEKIKRVFKNPQGFINAVGDVVKAGEERISSRIDTIKPSLENAFNEVKGYISSDVSIITDDLVYRTLERLDKAVVSPVKDEIASAEFYIVVARDNIKNTRVKIDAEMNEKIINTRKSCYEKVFETQQWFETRAVEIIMTGEVTQRVELEKLGGAIAGEEGQTVRQKVERKKKAADEILRKKVAIIELKENPYLKAFQKEVDREVVWVETLPVEVVEIPSEETYTFRKIELSEEEKAKMSDAEAEKELFDEVMQTGKEAADSTEARKDNNYEIESWEGSINSFNDAMIANLAEKNLDPKNKEYEKFLVLGNEIAEITRKLKRDLNPQEKYKLMSEYYNLVMRKRFPIYIMLS